MNHEQSPSADEKALALAFAYTALVKSLVDSGVLERDALFTNLAGATTQLESIGQLGAAQMLGQLNQTLMRI